MRNFHKAALTVLAGSVLLLAGCSSVQLDESAKQGTSAAEAMARAKAQSASPFKPDSVYFDFDSYTVKPEYIPVIERHARALIASPKQAVQVQGNTDSRGSREYNLALGQKRSEAVKQRLQLFGVPASRIEAVSFGSEKPVASGENEEAWALNRRADVVAP